VLSGVQGITGSGISGVENRLLIGVRDSASARRIALRLAQEGVPPEAVRLAIMEDEERARRTLITAPYVVARAHSPSHLELHVGLMWADGKPVAGMDVELARNNECIRVEATNDSGIIVFDSLPPGEYFVSVLSPEGVATGLLPLPSRNQRSTLLLTGNTPEEHTFKFILVRLEGWPATYRVCPKAPYRREE
jgi:hypothetical protein